MLSNNIEIKIGSKFINERNGGQNIEVTSLSHQGIEDCIEYKLEESFRFNSLKVSNCDIEMFRKTFSELKN